jgi:hypothetical protein
VRNKGGASDAGGALQGFVGAVIGQDRETFEVQRPAKRHPALADVRFIFCRVALDEAHMYLQSDRRAINQIVCT